MAESSGPSPQVEYKVADQKVDEELKNARAAIRVVACTDGCILTGSSRPVVKVWQVAEAKVTEKQRLSHGALGSSSVHVTSDGNVAAVCSDDGGIMLWDLRQKLMVNELDSSISNAQQAKFLPCDTKLVSAGTSGTICFWDLRNSRLVSELGNLCSVEEENKDVHAERKRRRLAASSNGHKMSKLSPVYSLAVSIDGSYLGCGRGTGEVSVLRLKNMTWAGDVHVHTGEQVAVRSVAFDPASRFLLSGGDDNQLCILDALRWARQRERREPQVERIVAHRSRITSSIVSPDPSQSLVVSTSYDMTVKLWDFKSHRGVGVFREHKDSVLAAAFEPTNGNFFATVGADSKLVFYKAETPKQEQETPVAADSAEPDAKKQKVSS